MSKQNRHTFGEVFNPLIYFFPVRLATLNVFSLRVLHPTCHPVNYMQPCNFVDSYDVNCDVVQELVSGYVCLENIILSS